MKNCVYYSFYGNPSYLKLIELSVKSLNMFFTKQHIYLFSDRYVPSLEGLVNVIHSEYPTGHAKPMAHRFALFQQLANEYDNILHLDGDTICINSIDEMFNVVVDGEISVASEMVEYDLRKRFASFDCYKNHKNLNITENYWAGPLLSSDEKREFSNVKNFSAGIYCANKNFSNDMRLIYQEVEKQEDLGFRDSCYDQHAFCKFLVKTRKFNYNLQDFVSHSGTGIIQNNEIRKAVDNKLSVLHYPGLSLESKYDFMLKSLEQLRRI